MVVEEIADQAPEQSVMERLASKFEPRVQEQVHDTPEASDDLAEVEFEGATYRLPPKLKDALLRNEDYTRKTQDLAEQRRSLEQARELTIQQQLDAAFGGQISSESQEISVIDAYLAQASKQDWGSMNTEQMIRTKMELDNVKERKAALEAAIGSKRSQFKTQFDAKLDELSKNARDIASKAIPNFSEQTEKEIREFAISEGFTEAEAKAVMRDARSIKALYKALQYEKVQKGTDKARESASKVDRVLKPGAAGERIPAGAAAKSHFDKAMREAPTSAAKANLIAQRLEDKFMKGAFK